MTSDLYDGVVGQERAVALLAASAARPVHAYLLVGPPGTGKRAAAAGFAASLLCAASGGTPAEGPPRRRLCGWASGHDGELCESCRRVLAGVHPDVVHVEREGAFIGIDAAQQVTRLAQMSPVEAPRKVVVLHEFHLVRDAAPALLKTIEEPPASTFFVILADQVPAELVTIASRCVTVEFDALTEERVAGALIADGVDPGRARALAAAAGGRLDRARLLATDEGFEARRRAWLELPGRLDGTGATAAALADGLLSAIEASAEPLRSRQAAELEALAERGRVSGGGRGRAARGSAAEVKEAEERHRREARRQRTDELRAGLATLAAAYRERLAAGCERPAAAGSSRSGAGELASRGAAEAVRLVDAAARSLELNPNETLLLQALLARLGRLGSRTAA
jgi:DNA polymerase-3 subunit delta'